MLLVSFVLFVLVLDAYDLSGDRTDLDFRDRAFSVADVERVDELAMLPLQLAVRHGSRRALKCRLARLLDRDLGFPVKPLVLGFFALLLLRCC